MTELSATQRARRRQIYLAIAIAGGLFGIVSIGVLMTGAGDGDVPKATDIKTRSYIAPGEDVAPEDAWRGVSDSRLSSIEHKLKVLENDSRDLKGQLDAPKKDPLSANELDARLREYEQSVANQYPPGRPSDPAPALAAQRPAAAPAVQAPPVPQPAGTTDRTPQAAPPAAIVTIRLREPERAIQPPSATTSAGTDRKQDVPRTTDNYLASGAFGPAALLSGLDAPTGGQSQSNPHPVLLKLTDLATLPNRYRHDWKYCHVIGAGYGDLSSERAYIRTESLSCVGHDKRVLDVPIKGYIVGEDGKAGMRGRVVSKQGQVLGNALLAGVVGGIGTGIERAASLQSVSPLGATSTTKPGDEFQAALGTGMGRAVDRLSNYYISLAEKLFPVIEVDAGREVDVILTEGVHTDVQHDH